MSEKESEPLVKTVQLSYGVHTNAPENGTHLATISLVSLNTEECKTKMSEFTRLWRKV